MIGPVVGAADGCAADVPDGGEVDGALQAVRAASAAAAATRAGCILTTASSRGRGQDGSTPVQAVSAKQSQIGDGAGFRTANRSTAVISGLGGL